MSWKCHTEKKMKINGVNFILHTLYIATIINIPECLKNVFKLVQFVHFELTREHLAGILRVQICSTWTWSVYSNVIPFNCRTKFSLKGFFSYTQVKSIFMFWNFNVKIFVHVWYDIVTTRTFFYSIFKYVKANTSCILKCAMLQFIMQH